VIKHCVFHPYVFEFYIRALLKNIDLLRFAPFTLRTWVTLSRCTWGGVSDVKWISRSDARSLSDLVTAILPRGASSRASRVAVRSFDTMHATITYTTEYIRTTLPDARSRLQNYDSTSNAFPLVTAGTRIASRCDRCENIHVNQSINQSVNF